ncbi:MAG: hypothetical protein D6B25_20480 [Desulfobulbaceae bacterium]|nr:MAG: hypothetical protein D6B25_20480 [Desulfobulbaceae bacterium]
MKRTLFSVPPLIFAALLVAQLNIASALNAQTNFKMKPKLSEKQSTIQPTEKPKVSVKPALKVTPAQNKLTKALPDLLVKSLSLSSLPKVGDTLGMNSVLNITVHNQGAGESGPSKLNIKCHKLSGADCPAALSGTLTVDPLGHNKSVSFGWPSASPSSIWKMGKYRIVVEVDSANQVAETSESNNSRQLLVSVRPNLQISQQMKPVKPNTPNTSISVTIPIHSPAAGSTHVSDTPLSIKWNPGPINYYSYVKIELVRAQENTVAETITTNADNSGSYNNWTPPANLAWPGNTYKIKITSPDKKITGYSGAFAITTPAAKEKKAFYLDAQITNSFAHHRNGPNMNSADCLSAPSPAVPGHQPGSSEIRIGHSQQEFSHGSCSGVESYYFRSRIYFDTGFLKGKEVLEATLQIRKGDTFTMVPDGTLGTNQEIASNADIYVLNAPWPASPQPLTNFYPGTFLKSFHLYGAGETAKIDLLNVVKDWAAGKTNQGLMVRDPLNESQYAPSANIKYYHSIKLVGTYLD